MGHRLSRTYWGSTNSGSNNNTNSSRDTTQRQRSNINPEITNHSYSVDNSHFRSGEIPFQTTTVTIPAQSAARSVIIKIQLSKMESDAPIPITTLELPSNSSLSVAQEVPTTSSSTPSSLNNLNRLDNHDENFNITAITTQQPVLNVTVTNPVTVDNPSALNQLSEDVKLNNINSQIHSTILSNNNNTNFQEIKDRVNQFSANISVLSNDGVKLNTSTNSNACTNIPNNLNNNTVRCENGTRSNNVANIIENKVNNVNVCQNQIGNATIRHLPQQNQPGTSSSNVTDGDGQTTCCQQKNYPFTSKWAFCECAYRDGVKNFAQFAPNLDVGQEETVAKGLSSGRNKWTNKLNCTKRNDDQSSEENVDEESVPQEVVIPTTSSQLVAGPPCVIVLSVNHSQAPQFVVGSVEDCDERARRQRALEIEQGLEATPGFIPQHQQIISHFRTSQIPPNLPFQQSNILPEFAPAIAAAMAGSNAWHMHAWHGPKVHSQMDFIHCLVPDLDKITSSSFYWGKMDRYEAERLLEGKPEGTFLLRDSAQEEYLFSVTFRKYGRSLHARIEQFNHKFSFDCHDPCVYTARTVTGLLEHYKDPSCVMFFEPMLTIPLHRNFTFSLQQLCRATISSRITYDGIKELHLPNTLKSYLREYHYKLLVRIKPVEELFYSCS